MTGDEHYAEAEAELVLGQEAETSTSASYHHDRAQIHATLSLAWFIAAIEEK